MSSEYQNQERLVGEQSRHSELQQAQAQAQQVGHERSPIMDFGEADPTELFDKLTDADVQSEQYEELQALLQPYLSSTQMLASHDAGEYYDDLSRELLNENLADRLVKSRERGRLLTGPFLEVAREVEHEHGVIQSRPLSPSEKEALRVAITDVRTDRQSLGDGTLLEAVTKVFVESSVRRDEEQEESGGGLLSALNPF